MNTVIFVLKFRYNGKVKTRETVLYSGEDSKEAIRIREQNYNSVLHTWHYKLENGVKVYRILENNVD